MGEGKGGEGKGEGGVPQLGDPVEIEDVGDVVLDELLDDVPRVHFGDQQGTESGAGQFGQRHPHQRRALVQLHLQ